MASTPFNRVQRRIRREGIEGISFAGTSFSRSRETGFAWRRSDAMPLHQSERNLRRGKIFFRKSEIPSVGEYDRGKYLREVSEAAARLSRRCFFDILRDSSRCVSREWFAIQPRPAECRVTREKKKRLDAWVEGLKAGRE